MERDDINKGTDIYFNKTKLAISENKNLKECTVTYGVFLRHESICAVATALHFIRDCAPNTIINKFHEEGALVASETPLFSYTGKLTELVELETFILQKVGFSCISAYNAYKMSMACPNIGFIDMSARHTTGQDMMVAASYGASVGSRSAKFRKAKGFIGSSTILTTGFYGATTALGTTPHVLIGAAGSTLNSVEMFIKGNPEDKFVVALVDYYGMEYTDTIEVLDWFNRTQKYTDRTLGVRLDTHGGRFAEGLDYEKSVGIVADWLHISGGKWEIVRSIMGDDAFDFSDDSIRDSVAKVLFGTGVSAANIILMRKILNNLEGGSNVKIVASSGFDLTKCKIMARVRAPIDIIGTGSFLPATLSETYATCDCVSYNGVPSIKTGREWLRDAIMAKNS